RHLDDEGHCCSGSCIHGGTGMSEISFINTPPRVFLVGISTPQYNGFEDYLAYRGVEWHREDTIFHPEAIVEGAGRVCYQSWHNPAGKTRLEYLQTSIIEHMHGSVLEHLWVNLMVADLPRSAQLELVRHGEGTGFSFESTRYTDAHMRFVIPPAIRNDPEEVELFKADCLVDAER